LGIWHSFASLSPPEPAGSSAPPPFSWPSTSCCSSPRCRAPLPSHPKAVSGSLRVVTFNLWGRNHHLEEAAKYLAYIDADAVVLEEVRQPLGPRLLGALSDRYPHRIGDTGIVILSKYPIVADGRVDREGYSPWISLMVRWVRLDVNGTQVELAGIHLARPFYPELQQRDILTLTQFVRSRPGPLIVAGDFNMAPWTDKLKTFTRATGLGRLNTFLPT
jgi:endonuclease/exonuclease/phosphatase (EEP) superfamily protein YafD